MTTTIAALEQELAALHSALDVLRAPQRELEALETRVANVTNRINTIRTATALLAEVEPRVEAEAAYRDFLTQARKTLSDELLALPGRARTSLELGQRENLRLSILTIDKGLYASDGSGWILETLRLGQLMRDAGIRWGGSLPEVQQRWVTLEARRDSAQAERDAARRDEAARAPTVPDAPVRKTRGDGTQYDKYPDGRRIDVDAPATG